MKLKTPYLTVSELLVILDKIRIGAKKEDFMVKIKKSVTSTGNKYKKVFVMMYVVHSIGFQTCFCTGI